MGTKPDGRVARPSWQWLRWAVLAWVAVLTVSVALAVWVVVQGGNAQWKADLYRAAVQTAGVTVVGGIVAFVVRHAEERRSEDAERLQKDLERRRANDDALRSSLEKMMDAYHQAKRVRRLWNISHDAEASKRIPALIMDRHLTDLIDAQLRLELLARLVTYSPDPRRELLATIGHEAKRMESYLNSVLKQCRDALPADASVGSIEVADLEYLRGFLDEEFKRRVSHRIDVVLRAVEDELAREPRHAA